MNIRIFKVGMLAIALLPGLAVAQSGITSDLDASIRFGLGFNTEPDTDLSFRNYSSRIRWAGSADVSDNLQVLSYLEFGFDQDEGVANTRHAWIGATGDFGTITGGKQYTAFYDAVTSKVDVAYWASCVLAEIGCRRQSSVVKYATNERDGMQLIGSATLIQTDEDLPDGFNDDDLIDGLDIAVKLSAGEIELGAGISYLGDRSGTFDGVNVVRLDSGFAAGVSAAMEVANGTASATIQYASDDYIGNRDNGIGITATYSVGQIYGLVGLADADNTPLFVTAGYVKPIVPDRALAYFEAGVIDTDEPGSDADLQGRAVLVFNFGKHSGS
jgi:predicted porin